MSFSLSSLLNPEPAQKHQTQQHDAPDERRPSLLRMNHVKSPEQHYATAPQQSGLANAQEAAETLAALSARDAPQYCAYDGSGASFSDRRSLSFGTGMDLPPPTASLRKMSSPTLEQYQVASRSPEMRRPSMASSAQPGITLPPIQGTSTGQQEQVRRPWAAESPHVNTDIQPSQASHPATTSETSLGTTRTSETPQGPVKATSVETGHHSQPVQETEIVQPSLTAPTTTSPPTIKEETLPTPQQTSPVSVRPSPNHTAETDGPVESQSLKTMPQIKNASRSPLRESSVPVPSTETPLTEQLTASKKRPAPKTKKGTATTSKKAPPSKKRKLDVKRSETPSSRASKPAAFKAGSTKGTPLNSSPAPSNRSYSADPTDDAYGDEDVDEDEDVEGDGEVYCLCRKPDNGTFMIGCDGNCDDWFHGKCVGVEERNKHLIDQYMCPNCTKKGLGQTSWKRMCRRGRCRQPARVGKSKTDKNSSKYCSDECGVQYFREMVANTRNREDTLKSRSSRRKTSVASSERPSINDSLGARGGVLAAGEVKSLMNVSKTAEDFQKLGEGVLSPPATPDGKDKKQSEYTGAERSALERIHTQKEHARRRHQTLKDRMKFITMAKQAASRTATEKELKPKDYCGYDPRLEWTEEQFAAWRASKVGKQAFELETLAIEASGEVDRAEEQVMDGIYDEIEICDRKKCARHLEWGKLAVDDIRFEMNDNSDNMRALDKEERETEERAAIRAKAGGLNSEGSVEVHGLGISGLSAANGDSMEVGQPAKTTEQPAGNEEEAVATLTAIVPEPVEVPAMEIDGAA